MTPTPNQEPLLPCPFCGSTFIQYSDRFNSHKIWCENCLIATPPTKSKDYCFKAWNTRTAQPALSENVEQTLARVRKEANNWTPEYRAELFKKGMEIINSTPSAPAKMKTAEEWIEIYKADKVTGNLKRTVAWTTGDLCRAIQADALNSVRPEVDVEAIATDIFKISPIPSDAKSFEDFANWSVDHKNKIKQILLKHLNPTKK